MHFCKTFLKIETFIEKFSLLMKLCLKNEIFEELDLRIIRCNSIYVEKSFFCIQCIFFSQKCSFEIWLINFLQALFLLEFYLLPNIVLFTCSSQLLICYCRECIGTKLLYTFPSPKPFHFCNSEFFSRLMFILLKKSEKTGLHFQF